ncbi:MAG: asparagine synthase-related protein [Pseudomonadota bacterium]
MTMYRYITLLWNRTDREAEKAVDYITAQLHEVSPHAWRKAWSAQGIAVFDSGEHKGRMQTYHLHDEGGVVLGRLFHNNYASQSEDLDAVESRSCLKTRGQHLIDKYWGRYVAFLHDRSSGTNYIMRDPSGAFPCFHTPFRGVEIYFSDMQDAANFPFLPFTVNWEYLKTNIMLPQFQKTHTGLNEVGEVLPAECVEITPFERKSRFVWDPTEISQTDVVEDPAEAAALLHSTVKNTIGALAGCYDSVVHNLGGLDSSIVLACLANAPKRPEITAINFYTKSPRGEERFYSRQVAEKFGVPLVESELDYRKADLSKIFESNKLANPLGFFDCIGLTGDVLALAKEKNAQALFYGTGGDNVFFKLDRNLGALDYLRSHGFSKDMLRVAMEASRYGRKSLARTLRDILREQVAPAPCFEYVHKEMFARFKIPLVNPEFVGTGTQKQFLHPLLIPEENNLKGKYLHILICAFFSMDYYDHWHTDYHAERIHAYFTQPVVETCLRIPIWVMTYGGVERGLARKAFQHNLPQDIVKRFSKSTPGEYYRDIYKHNTDFLRDILLDGVMVREKILSRKKIEEALGNENYFLQVLPHRILGYLATEVWLRSWTERPANQIKSAGIAI